MTIVKDLDVLENINGHFQPAPIVPPMHALQFQRGKEPFRHGLIKTIPCSTYATGDAMIFEGLLKIEAGILTATI